MRIFIPFITYLFILHFSFETWAIDRPLKLGSVQFRVGTNRLITVNGKIESLKGIVTIDLDGGLPTGLEFQIPVEKMKTGMSLRDRHMRERIFQTQTKTIPDIHFRSESIQCQKKTNESLCKVKGSLAIRGMKKLNEFEMLYTPAAGSQGKLKGSAKVILSDYSIPPPSQLGVTVNNEVEITFEVDF